MSPPSQIAASKISIAMYSRALSRHIASLECRRCFHQALSLRKLVPIESPRSSPSSVRCYHATQTVEAPPSAAPRSKDRGPPSKEDTQTDFDAMNIFSNTPTPTTAIDACLDDGFALNSGVKIKGGGALLVGGEAFKWRPWAGEEQQEENIASKEIGTHQQSPQDVRRKIRNHKGQFDVDRQSWGVLDLVWPKPDLLILGTGPSIAPVSANTRRHIRDLGIRLEVQDTRNAAAQFNLLATERGVQQVAAALIPIGWRE
ncbi:hypothetical protein M433DRAFT_257017 [Acidomyces richmondensis BFW]|nr:MAG: hypothetical protein FE78DRAFT_402549 [Acidomyces sp. 'richmondensis']KYG45429.1 hypothetical protein M433DRAFT_257017 [Acidomyces richmondensis BFW]